MADIIRYRDASGRFISAAQALELGAVYTETYTPGGQLTTRSEFEPALPEDAPAPDLESLGITIEVTERTTQWRPDGKLDAAALIGAEPPDGARRVRTIETTNDARYNRGVKSGPWLDPGELDDYLSALSDVGGDVMRVDWDTR